MKRILLMITAAALVGSASAEWSLFKDFEDGDNSDWSVTSTNATTITAVGRVDIVDDPVASGQGKVAAIVNPIGSTDGSNSSMVLPLGEFAIVDPFPLTTKQTFYFKLLRPLVDGSPGELNTTIGFMSSEEWGIASGVTPPTNEEPDLIPSWGQYSSIVRYETDGIFDIRDGGAYYNISDTAQDTNVWYEVWMVHDHADNSYQVYLKGGADYPEQALVTVEVVIDATTTQFAGNKAKYRVETFTPLDWLFIKPNGGSESAPEGKDDTFIDDLYFDNSGENLTTPGGATGGPSNELINISTRGLVGLADEIMVGGFVSQGEAAGGTILVRGIGPTLGGFGVANTVEDPVIRVFDGTGTMIAENDDWGDDADVAAAAEAVGAFALEAGSTDAAMLMTGLAPGAYTVQLSGKGTTAQNGLLEVYKVE